MAKTTLSKPAHISEEEFQETFAKGNAEYARARQREGTWKQTSGDRGESKATTARLDVGSNDRTKPRPGSAAASSTSTFDNRPLAGEGTVAARRAATWESSRARALAPGNSDCRTPPRGNGERGPSFLRRVVEACERRGTATSSVPGASGDTSRLYGDADLIGEEKGFSARASWTRPRPWCSPPPAPRRSGSGRSSRSSPSGIRPRYRPGRELALDVLTGGRSRAWRWGRAGPSSKRTRRLDVPFARRGAPDGRVPHGVSGQSAGAPAASPGLPVSS